VAVLAVFLLLAAACRGGTTAQDDTAADQGQDQAAVDFPTREITFIVPFPAGAAPNATFRLLSSVAEQELGQPIVVVNRAGAGATVGTAELAAAAPDGYTIGMGSTGPLMLQPSLQDTTYEGPEDFAPILQTDAAPMVLFSSAASGITNFQDYLAAAQADPGGITYGVIEHSTLHAEAEILMEEAGMELTMVPYTGGEQVIAAVNGIVDSAIAQPAVVQPHAEAGSVHILGVFGERKPDGLDAPLFTELGYPPTPIVDESVLAPAGTPDEIVQIIHDAYRVAVESEEFAQYAQENGLLVEYLGPQELEEKFERDKQFFDELLAELGWVEQ
jgi:tripartite-type tricarboxylate transporter receptor subunit TctC